ncbi:MAG: DUF4440 domain-containing protein [Saprospiraceae bacterium]|nr:DUF4440 domain-containing protein [Pyrinomonadaceae bacterium]
MALAILLFSVAVFAQNEKEKVKIESDIISVMDEQTAAWNRGDIDSFMKGYWNSENLIFVSGDNITRGWQQTLDRYKKSYDTKAKMGALKFGDVSVNVISKDAAVVLGSWSLAREKDNPKGKFTLIFRKFRDSWRIVHDHTS